MTASATLKTLSALIDELQHTEGTKCTQLCMTIDHILDKLEDWAETSEDAKRHHPLCNQAGFFIDEMRSPLYSIAGLMDTRHSKESCIMLLIAGINKLAGKNCLAVEM